MRGDPIFNMPKLLKTIIRNECGQALPVVLAVMLLGGLVVPPVIDHAATGVRSARTIAKGVGGIYAAEAGVEQAIWSIRHNVAAPTQLPETINQMQVALQTEDRGSYTAYFGEFVPAGEHNDWLDVAGEMVPDGEPGRYRYTITVNWQPIPGTPEIHLGEVGIRLPPGYIYQEGSAADFSGNLATTRPSTVQDAAEAWMLKWTFSEPRPVLSKQNPVGTQSVYVNYVSGSGDLNGNYAWAVAVRTDVGVVGSIVGTLYIITSTATFPQDGEVTGRVRAEILEAEKTYIIAWRISK